MLSNFIKCTVLFFFALFSNEMCANQPVPNGSATIYSEAKNHVILSGKERTFTVHLKSNPTTGYQWYLRDYHTKMMMPIAHRFVAAEEKLIGSGGVEEWEFRVSDQAMAYPHQLTLRMIYARPSQGTEASTTVVFRVSTHP